MNNTDFSKYLVKTYQPSQKKEPVDFSQYKIEDEKKDPSRLKSLLSAVPKGIIKGGAELSSMVPFFNKPIPEEYGLKLTEEMLPTQQKFAEKALERGGKLIPLSVFSEGSIVTSAIRSLIGGLGGETAKEVGGGPVSEILGEMIGLSFPFLSKQIVSKKSQKPLIDFARKMGMTESEISPLIQGKMKEGIVSKFGSGDKIRSALKKSREATGRIYTTLSESPIANNPLPQESVMDLMKGLKEQLKSLPSGVRKIAMRDMIDLFKGEVNGKNLINLYQDLNYYIRKGNPLLSKLKGPVEDAIGKISPEFAEDFAMTNKLWENAARFGKKIKKDLIYDIKSLGKLGSVASAVFTGNMKPLIAYTGLAASEPILVKLATNPRLQNLSMQVIKSLNESKISQAKKIGEILEIEFEKKLFDQLQKHEDEE